MYEWEQSLEEVNVFLSPPKGVTARDIVCDITATHVTLGLRGVADKYLNVSVTCIAIARVCVAAGLRLTGCVCSTSCRALWSWTRATGCSVGPRTSFDGPTSKQD